MIQVPLTFITGNAGKFAEVQSLIPTVQQLDLDLEEIQELDPQKIIEHKLQEALRHHRGPLLIEDTSLYIEGMQGLPGPLIKWFLKTVDTSGLFTLAQASGSTRATARTVLGYAASADEIAFFVGEVAGQVVAPRGDQGFGWDVLFVPDGQPSGQAKTFGEMTRDEKQEWSMRQRAVVQLQTYLNQ